MLLAGMAKSAAARFSSDAAWAAASGLSKETLSRLKRQPSCDLRTLDALARSAGCRLVVVPETGEAASQAAGRFTREDEDRLLELAASGATDAAVWRAHGPGFFMGGLAVLLASARGFDRERYLRLAESLHAGVSTPEVFGLWLRRSPLRPARFLPAARRRRGA